MNDLGIALTCRFEENVGNKTTFNVVNRSNQQKLIKGTQAYDVGYSWEKASLVVFESAHENTREKLAEPLLKKFGHLHPIFLNPAFSNDAHMVRTQLDNMPLNLACKSA